MVYLKIENYNVWIPQQWENHHQARTLIYTRDHLSVKQINTGTKTNDLPIVILDIGIQGAKKTRVCGI